MIHINKLTLLNMLELSSCAYKNNMPLCRSSSYEIIKDKSTDTECFINKSGSKIIIIFRGTDSKINSANNLYICKKTMPYGIQNSKIKVHSGFLAGYKSIRNTIHSKIPSDVCKIKITGHSLGAALAVLCAIDIQYNFKNSDIEVYLFGCPRVGNAAFVKSYNKRVFKTLRVTNGNDIVTKLPLGLFGYRHVGINIHTGPLRLPFIFSFSQHQSREYYKSLWQSL